MKTVRDLWQGITASRRTREREAAAQYERVHREGALRDEFARRTHALEAQIAQAHSENCRLRAENRALLNSVLGIAGIPPVIVAEPPAPLSHGRHSEKKNDEEPLFGSSARLGAQSKRDPSLPLVAQVRYQDSGGVHRTPETGDDGAIGVSVAPYGSAAPSTNLAPNGTTLPSSFAGRSSAAPLPGQTPDASTPVGTNAASPQKQLRRALAAPHARNDTHAIAPIRRRSWHQIYRMLEFESSRRKDQDS